jgi:hypothetical protein
LLAAVGHEDLRGFALHEAGVATRLLGDGGAQLGKPGRGRVAV